MSPPDGMRARPACRRAQESAARPQKSLSRQKKTWTLPHIIWGYDSCAAHGSAYPRTKRSSAWIRTSVPTTWCASPPPNSPKPSSTSRLPQSASRSATRRSCWPCPAAWTQLRRRGAAHQGHRQAAHLRAREPRPYAQGRNRAGHRRVPRTSWTRTWSTWTPPTASWTSWPASSEPETEAQDHRRASSSACSRRRPARSATRSNFLAQGTIYPDILESQDGVVKAHHNVGGLPEDLQFELVEPAEAAVQGRGARRAAATLGLPDEHGRPPALPRPRPGRSLPRRHHPRPPGGAARGRRHRARGVRQRPASRARSGSTSPCVPDFRATGVRDGVRAYEWPAIIRAVNTVDAMTAEVPELDWALLQAHHRPHHRTRSPASAAWSTTSPRSPSARWSGNRTPVRFYDIMTADRRGFSRSRAYRYV